MYLFTAYPDQHIVVLCRFHSICPIRICITRSGICILHGWSLISRFFKKMKSAPFCDRGGFFCCARRAFMCFGGLWREKARAACNLIRVVSFPSSLYKLHRNIYIQPRASIKPQAKARTGSNHHILSKAKSIPLQQQRHSKDKNKSKQQ